jgi:hypothetical protein
VDVISIEQGSYGNVDLSGLKVGLVARIPGFVLDGNWEVGILVSDSADDQQLNAVQTIFGGEAGGQFADLAGLIGTVKGLERAKINYESSPNGDSGSVTVGNSHFTYEPLMGPGGRTELVHGAVTFRDRIYPGKSVGGHIDDYGITSDTYYGEWCDVEFAGP